MCGIEIEIDGDMNVTGIGSGDDVNGFIGVDPDLSFPTAENASC